MTDFGSAYLDTTTPQASGWQTYPTSYGWRWSAYGPRGNEAGRATSKSEAESRARQAERRLREPRVA